MVRYVNEDNETVNETLNETNEPEEYYFQMGVSHVVEKDIGWEITVSIISNTVAMVFVVIGAVIAFFLKKYIMMFFNRKEKEKEEDEIPIDKDEPIKP
jgi:hypothetical protein